MEKHFNTHAAGINIGNQKTVSIDFDLDVSKDTQRGLEQQNLRRSIFIIRSTQMMLTVEPHTTLDMMVIYGNPVYVPSLVITVVSYLKRHHSLKC